MIAVSLALIIFGFSSIHFYTKAGKVDFLESCLRLGKYAKVEGSSYSCYVDNTYYDNQNDLDTLYRMFRLKELNKAVYLYNMYDKN